MSTLDYAAGDKRSKSAICGIIVFAPTMLTVALYVTFFVHPPDDMLVLVLMVGIVLHAPLVSSLATATLLIIWRQRLHIITLICGWLVCIIGLAFWIYIFRTTKPMRLMSP